jgi:hypothetical protein
MGLGSGERDMGIMSEDGDGVRRYSRPPGIYNCITWRWETRIDLN